MSQRCARCGTPEIPEEQQYCSFCGARLQPSNDKREFVAGCLLGCTGLLFAAGGSCLAMMANIATSHDEERNFTILAPIGMLAMVGSAVLLVRYYRRK